MGVGSVGGSMAAMGDDEREMAMALRCPVVVKNPAGAYLMLKPLPRRAAVTSGEQMV